MKRILSILAAVGAMVSATASAQSASDDVQHNVSVTISPIHLALPVIELTGEYRITPKMGAAAILGAGSVTAENSEKVTVIEVGGQFAYYALGTFIHGLQVGAEAIYLYANADQANIDVSGNGLAIGPFLGYKIATNIGFTFVAQGGVQYVTAKASATDGTNTASESDKDIIPLLNLNVGWSF